MRGYKTDNKIVQNCLRLRRQGLSLGEICAVTHLSKTTVHSYIRSTLLLPHQKLRIQRKMSELRKVANFKRKGVSRPHNRLIRCPLPSLELIRVIAHFCFDGSIQKHAVSYYNRSEILIQNQEQSTEKLFGIHGKLYLRPDGVTHISFQSVELVHLVKYYRSQILKDILAYPHEWQRVFLQAFFDDEGNIDINKQEHRRRIRGYQYNFSILNLIQLLLKNFGIDSVIDTRARCVVIGKYENLVRFQKEINFSSGIYMNHLRKNSRYTQPMDKRLLLSSALNSQNHLL